MGWDTERAPWHRAGGRPCVCLERDAQGVSGGWGCVRGQLFTERGV